MLLGERPFLLLSFSNFFIHLSFELTNFIRSLEFVLVELNFVVAVACRTVLWQI